MKKAVLLITLLSFCSTPPTPVSVTADELVSAYSENIVAAKEKYQNKPVNLSGQVLFIDDKYGVSVIFNTNGDKPFVVAANFKDKQKVVNLAKLQQVAFPCTVRTVEAGKDKAVINLDC